MSGHLFHRRHGPDMPRRMARKPSPVLAYLTPWATIMLASLLPDLPTIASVPLMPPLGYLTMLAWRQLHPGLLPVWAGLPLGLADDMVSGQPVGSAILLWSVSMLALDAIEARFPWRNFIMEWLVASIMIAAYVALSGFIASGMAAFSPPWLVGWPLVLAVLAYPAVGRVVAWFDRWRLGGFRVMDRWQARG